MKYLLIAVLCSGCAGFFGDPEHPECSDAALAELTAAEIVETVHMCSGFGTSVEDCPFIEQIRADYEAKRQAWVRCGQ